SSFQSYTIFPARGRRTRSNSSRATHGIRGCFSAHGREIFGAMSARRRFVDHRPSSKRCRALDRCATPAIVRGVAFRRTRWRATERASPASSKPPLPLGGSTAFHSHGTTFELLSRRDRERQHTHGAATSPVRMYLLQPEPEPEPEPDRCERGPLAQVPLERVWRMSGALEPLRFGRA